MRHTQRVAPYCDGEEFCDTDQGDFQSIDFRQPGSGLFDECGLGAELALMLPLLAWYHRVRGLSRSR